MRIRKTNIVCLVLLTTLVAMNAHAQLEVAPLLTFDAWRVTSVGVQTDYFDELSPTLKSLNTVLTPLMLSSIDKISAHYLSREELQRAREYIKADALSILGNQATKLYESRASKVLDNSNFDAYLDKITLGKEIRKVNRRIKRVRKTPLEDIDVNNTLPVEFITQSDYVSISRIEDFNDLAVKLNVHSIIYYRLYELEEYVVIELYEYSVLRESSRLAIRTVVSPDNITQIYNSLESTTQTVVSGEEVALLNVEVLGEDNEVLYEARILLDGEIIGFGSVSSDAIHEGAHAITVIYDAQERSEVVILEKNIMSRRTYFFDADIGDTILIESTPSNAKVYVNAEWVGNTPAVVPKPLSMQQLEIRHPGYVTTRLTIHRDSESLYKNELVPLNPISLEDRLATDRKKFYNAFTMFAFSLAVPLVINGFYVNEVNALSIGGAQLSSAGYAESTTRRDVLYYSYLGTTGISVGFGVFTYIRLRKYLKTASEFQER